MRYRFKILSGKQTLAMGSSPDVIRATNLAAQYAMAFFEGHEKITIKFEKKQQ